MCGLTGYLGGNSFESTEASKELLRQMSKNITHRGPDSNGIWLDEESRIGLAHQRLSVLDLTKAGHQPMISKNNRYVIVYNGEIYNHQVLRKQFEGKYEFQTQSDCEIILALYQEKQSAFLNDLNGIFGFAVYDSENDSYLIARDHMGIIPLYIGWDKNGTFYVASELKALESVCTKIELFPPGHYFYSKDNEFVQWYKRDWVDYDAVKNNETSIQAIKEALEAAVHRQLMSDVPYGVLLSGGLDSSVTSAIAKKYAQKRIESGDEKEAWWPQLHSFSVGLDGSPDLAAA